VSLPSVNNAGVGLLGPVESISIEDMKRVFETNFFGVVRMIKEVMPDMKKRRAGHIVVMSSVMGLQGKTGMPMIEALASAHTDLDQRSNCKSCRFRPCSLTTIPPDPESALPAGVVFNDVYTASKFAMEGFCESMAVQLLKFNVQ
jgi:retinol dehydrogenase-8